MAAGSRAVVDLVCAELWGTRCAACGGALRTPTRGAVCAACWTSVRSLISVPRCDGCGRPAASSARCPACAAPPRIVTRTRAGGLYEGALRSIVHAFKYDGHRSLAQPLAGLMQAAGADLLESADVLVPVPLHVTAVWKRGFNQADDLVRWMPGRSLRALRRRRWTRSQASLDESQRWRNVGGAFGPTWRVRLAAWVARTRRLPAPVRVPAHAWARRWSLDGCVVVLVDDVRTTGATLEACARVLRDLGAREVRAITAALVVREMRSQRDGVRSGKLDQWRRAGEPARASHIRDMP